jgi:hypothetical protein
MKYLSSSIRARPVVKAPAPLSRAWKASVSLARSVRFPREDRRAEIDRRGGLRERRRDEVRVLEERRSGPRDRRQYDRRRLELRVS